MLMPIVSMNKMAMNESVAATCCFREVATPTAIYWEVMHGGWIGSGYASTSTPKEKYKDMNSTWKSIKYDIRIDDVGVLDMKDDRLKYLAANETLNGENAGWYVADDGNWAGGAVVPLTNWLALRGANLITDATCDHTGTCEYMVGSTGFVKDSHFESTSAHSTGDWKVTHPAAQFAS